jgi:hypothetical protein
MLSKIRAFFSLARFIELSSFIWFLRNCHYSSSAASDFTDIACYNRSKQKILSDAKTFVSKY